MDRIYDAIVVGGGNAALCAALSAREHGAKVLLLERAPEDQRGGNSSYTGGGFRMVHHGVETVRGAAAHAAGGADHRNVAEVAEQEQVPGIHCEAQVLDSPPGECDAPRDQVVHVHDGGFAAHHDHAGVTLRCGAT